MVVARTLAIQVVERIWSAAHIGFATSASWRISPEPIRCSGLHRGAALPLLLRAYPRVSEPGVCRINFGQGRLRTLVTLIGAGHGGGV